MLSCSCNLCGSKETSLVSSISEKPVGETPYLKGGEIYYREIRHCDNCDVYFNCHEYELFNESFYEGEYNSAISLGSLEQRFNRIISLPNEKSDNIGRVNRIDAFLKEYFGHQNVRILDVGSGTGVFPYQISKLYKNVSAVDPDATSCLLMKKKLMLENIWNGSLHSIPTGEKFDLISFNKVLEHIQSPFGIVKTAKSMLEKSAVVYIELPYAEDIIAKGEQDARAEFFLEHFNTYTKKSLRFLLENAGLIEKRLETLVEPSGKHTIFVFAAAS